MSPVLRYVFELLFRTLLERLILFEAEYDVAPGLRQLQNGGVVSLVEYPGL